MSQSIIKFGTGRNQLKFDNLLDSTKIKSKGTSKVTALQITAGK